MRIPSGVTDQYIYFVAVDDADYVTRETGLSSFTVYRSRNGGAAAAMTTPTINETSSANMPGVYELLLDEDMTIDAGDDSQEMVFHITHAGMAPVTRTIELYRAKFTAGSTLSLADINAECDTALADYDPPTKAELDAGFAALNDLSAADVNAEVDTALADYDGPTKAEMDAGFAGLNDLDAAGIRGAVGLAAADLDAQLSAIDTVVDAILVDTGTTIPGLISGLNDLSAADVNAEVDTALADYDAPTKAEMDAGFAALSDPSAADIADAVWEEPLAEHAASGGNMAEAIQDIPTAVWTETLADHSGVTGSTAEALAAAGSAGDPWTTSLPGSYTGSQAGKMLSDVLTDTAVIGAAGAGLTAVPWNSAWDAEVQSEVTDALAAYDSPTKAEMDAGFAGLNDLDAAGIRAAVGLSAADLDTQLSGIDTVVDAVLIDTGTTIPGLIASLNDLDATEIRSAVGLAAANLDTQLDSVPTAIENADALLNRDMSAVSDTETRSPLNAFRFLRNYWSASGTTLTVRKEDDSTTAWTATLSTDAGADPVTGSNPL